MASYAMKVTLERIALFQFTSAHCSQARAMLGWTVDELSRDSGVSVGVIEQFEARRDVPDQDRLALAYRFESAGLVFFPGFAPGRKMSAMRSVTESSRRGDFAMGE